MKHRSKQPPPSAGSRGPSESSEREPVEARAGPDPRSRHAYVFSSLARPGDFRGDAIGGVESDPTLLRRLIAGDAYARFQQHRAREAWFPLGLDTFGSAPRAAGGSSSPAAADEAAAQRSSIERIAEALGIRKVAPIVSTGDPAYYRLTQWVFLELHARGLVYRATCRFDGCAACGGRFRQGSFTACPACGGELARREVVERRLDVTTYGDRLVGDLEGAERRSDARAHDGRPDARSDSRPESRPSVHRSVWSRRDRSLQREVLGRTRGCEVIFPVSRPFEMEHGELSVFTTRVEMLYGVTFILVEPFHPVLERVVDPTYEDDIVRYRERLRKGTEPRISGVRTGGFAINPLSLERIPILVSALACETGTRGAVLGIPGHDAEHFELAKRQRLSIREVVHNDAARFDHHSRLEQPWLGDGVLTNSGPFCGLTRKAARDRIIGALSRKGCCKKTTLFRFASLPLSAPIERGPPVPILHCESCGEVPVPEKDLPLDPPEPDRGGGASRGAAKRPCPGCGKKATPDPERILPWLGDAWSWIRLALPHLDGPLDGFRPMAPGAAEPSPSSGPEGAPPEAAPAASAPRPADAADRGGAPVAAPSDRPSGAAPEASSAGGAEPRVPAAPSPETGEARPTEPPAAEAGSAAEVLPEDVDIFRVPARVRTDDDGPEWQLGAEDLAPKEEGLAKDGGAEDGGAEAESDPGAPVPPGGSPPEGIPSGEPSREVPGEPPADTVGPVPPAGPDGSLDDAEPGAAPPASDSGAEGGARSTEAGQGEKGAGDAEALPAGDAAGRALRESRVPRSGRPPRPGRPPDRRGAAGAEAPPSVEEEEDEDEDEEAPRGFPPSALRPFESPDLARLPADLGLIPAEVPLRQLVGMRLVAKALHDLGHVPSHLPILSCIRVAPMLPAGRERTADAVGKGTARPPRPEGPEGVRTESRPSARGPGPRTPRPAGARTDGSSGAEAEPAPDLARLLARPETIGRFGADAVRLHVLFAGPLDRVATADLRAVRRLHRFLERIWNQMSLRRERGKFVSRRMLVEKHRLIDEITRRLAAGKFHTALAALMTFIRFLEDPETAPEDMDRQAMGTFIILLSPFAPRFARELWSLMGRTEDLDTIAWPVPSDELIHPPEREFLVIVDGKVRDRMTQPANLEPEKLESRALQRDRIRELVGNRKVRRVVVVPQKLVAIATEPGTV